MEYLESGFWAPKNARHEAMSGLRPSTYVNDCVGTGMPSWNGMTLSKLRYRDFPFGLRRTLQACGRHGDDARLAAARGPFEVIGIVAGIAVGTLFLIGVWIALHKAAALL
jgi:hypothetical protein